MRLGLFRGALVALLALLAIATVARWSTVVAQVRAVVIVSTLLEVPLLKPLVDAVTGEPQQEDTELAGLPTRIYRPSGEGPWPTVLFLTGADADGRKSEDIRTVGQALARAGYVTIVPDLPGLADGRVGTDAIDDVERAVVAASDSDLVAGDQVALVSVSAGASLALIAATRPQVAGRTSVVAGVAPFARVRTVLQIATTGAFTTPDGAIERYDTDPYLRRAVTGSLEQLGAGIPAVQRLVDNEDPRRFAELYDALPAPVRAEVEELSPLRRAGELNVRVELAAPPRDLYFPLSESEAIVEAAPDARLTVTGVLDHARPRPGLGDAGDLLAFNAFVVRVLRTAAD